MTTNKDTSSEDQQERLDKLTGMAAEQYPELPWGQGVLKFKEGRALALEVRASMTKEEEVHSKPIAEKLCAVGIDCSTKGSLILFGELSEGKDAFRLVVSGSYVIPWTQYEGRSPGIAVRDPDFIEKMKDWHESQRSFKERHDGHIEVL